MSSTENHSLLDSKSIVERYHPGIRLLGAGDESFVFTDDVKVYKIFHTDFSYYERIGRQIADRFVGLKHLYDVKCEVLDGHTVFIYDYERSRSYSGEMEEELIETLVEFASCGVVSIDIKPSNFRITEKGLKFIDYGHDLKPFSESEFINMVLNAFLCIRYWADPQFIKMSQITRYNWDKEKTKGFIEFFNKAYGRFMENSGSHIHPPFREPNNLWIESVVTRFSADWTKVYCLSDMSDELYISPIHNVEDIKGKDILIITRELDHPPELLDKMRESVRSGSRVLLIARNPFFHGDFSEYRNMMESEGLYFDILAHSEPRPCKGGMRSDYILLEIKNNLTLVDRPEVSGRNEDYIFVICGRNVPAECYMRCWESLDKLRCGRWGAVIIDDASDNGYIDPLIRSTAGRRKRVTYIRNECRKTMLPNLVHAIKDVCTNPNSVIITLDMDDALLNRDALCMVRNEYLRGHDVVSSTSLKKGVRILPYEIDYNDARGEKVGDVWMHLRSFRKYLFDRIDENDFKENGHWIEIFNELTFMIPISEMSSDPIQIKAPLYLWEPRTKDDDSHRAADLHTISLMRLRNPYGEYRVPKVLGEIRPPGMLVNEFSKGDVLIIRHAEKEDRQDYLSTERGITERGERESELFGSCLEHIDLFVCSEIRRTSETAYCMNKGNGGGFNLMIDPLFNALRYDYSKWCELKDKYGYLEILRMWRDNEFKNGELPDFRTYSVSFLEKLLKLSEGKTVCVVTHDHMICVLSSIFKVCKSSNVPYMGGFVLKRDEIVKTLNQMKTQ